VRGVIDELGRLAALAHHRERGLRGHTELGLELGDLRQARGDRVLDRLRPCRRGQRPRWRRAGCDRRHRGLNADVRTTGRRVSPAGAS